MPTWLHPVDEAGVELFKSLRKLSGLSGVPIMMFAVVSADIDLIGFFNVGLKRHDGAVDSFNV